MLDYEISPSEAAKLLREKGARLVDVREPWEFATARIEGARRCPWAKCRPARTRSSIPTSGWSIVCHRGVRSMNVTAWLRNQGFEQAQSLRGGIDAWSVEVDPSSRALLAGRLAPHGVFRTLPAYTLHC